MHHALVYLMDQQKATGKYASQQANFHAVIKALYACIAALYPRVKHAVKELRAYHNSKTTFVTHSRIALITYV